MARKLTFRDFAGSNGPFGMEYLYDISDPIGSKSGCTNSPDDVALVQFFLAGYFLTDQDRPLGKLSIDGKFGPMTHYWCLYFKDKMEFGMKKILSDSYNMITQYRSMGISALSSFMLFLNVQYFNSHRSIFNTLEEKTSTFPLSTATSIKRRPSTVNRGVHEYK